MRKENYLIAMINKDVLNLSLPVPFLRGRQLFSKTMEWYLHYCILDMAFNELGQVQQDFLRPDRRRLLSQKLKQRLMFAGFLNLIFAPVVLAYVIIVYFFTYYYVSSLAQSLCSSKANSGTGVHTGSQASCSAQVHFSSRMEIPRIQRTATYILRKAAHVLSIRHSVYRSVPQEDD
jgi:hypothetical protein